MPDSLTSPTPLLVIEGIDGSGKGTQSQRLHERLVSDGVSSQLFSFPRYNETFFGARIGDFLNGKFGTLDELNPFLVSLLYSGDRFESRDPIRQALDESQLVICDRYVPSNIAHQASKLDGEQRTRLIQWIEQIEYEIFEIPQPSHVVLLDTPVDVSQELIARKDARNYTDQAADLQESDVPYLAKVREVYLQQAANRNNWTLVPVTTSDGSLRTIEEISEEIYSIAQPLILQ